MLRNLWIFLVFSQPFATIAGGQEKLQIETGDRPIFDIVFSRDGRRVATTAGPVGQRVLGTWDLKTKKKLNVFHHRFGDLFPQFSQEGTFIHSLVCKVETNEAGWQLHECNIANGQRKVLFESTAREKPIALWMEKGMVVAQQTVSKDPKVGDALRFLNYRTKKKKLMSSISGHPSK